MHATIRLKCIHFCILQIKISGKGVSLSSASVEQTNDFTEIRKDFLDMMKPMVYKRLEWAVERILDYDLLWTECEHKK